MFVLHYVDCLFDFNAITLYYLGSNLFNWCLSAGEEALPGDAQLLQGDVKDLARDEWMTVLPPERQVCIQVRLYFLLL